MYLIKKSSYVSKLRSSYNEMSGSKVKGVPTARWPVPPPGVPVGQCDAPVMHACSQSC